MGLGNIECCNGCEPPKRSPTCHITCKDYMIEKTISEAIREQANAEKMVSYNIAGQRSDGIYKGKKRRRCGGNYAK